MDAFVTCIYNGLSNTKFCGRNHRDDRYRDSLLTIARTGTQIYCFTSSNDYTKLTKFFNDNNVDNIEFIILELNTLPFHNDIQRIKHSHPEKFMDLFWSQRCVEIMWGKIYMINHILIKNPQIENIFWIDAGLSHNDVISPKYRLKDDIEKNISSNAFTLFNDRFTNNLIKFCDNKLLLIECVIPHNTPIPSKYNVNPYKNHNGVIGGLFGGPKDKMQFLHDEFFKKVNAIIDDGVLYGEENILFGILTDYPDIFKTFEFSSWYHEGWKEWHKPTEINFSNFFDTITENDILIDDVVLTTVAIGEKYNNLCLHLLNTFLQHTTDMHLVILTDNVDFYKSYTTDKITVRFINISITSGNFPYNIKYKAINVAHDIFYNYKKILYLDADCYFIKSVSKDYFCNTKDGLNVVLGTHASKIQNPSIIQKIKMLVKRDDEADINSFRECALLFNIHDKYKFNLFLLEWENIFNEITKSGLVHVGEFSDISIAAKRANFPITNLNSHDLHELRECIFTTVQNTPVRAIL